MTDITIDHPGDESKTYAKRAWIWLAILMLLGLWSDVATMENFESCGVFTIGISAIGGCDVIR